MEEDGVDIGIVDDVSHEVVSSGCEVAAHSRGQVAIFATERVRLAGSVPFLKRLRRGCAKKGTAYVVAKEPHTEFSRILSGFVGQERGTGYALLQRYERLMMSVTCRDALRKSHTVYHHNR
jgi:hypothetical protein